MRHYRVLIISLWVLSCKAPQAVQDQSYSEDLRGLRPEIEVAKVERDTIVQSAEKPPMEGHLKMEIDSVSAMIVEQNKSKLWPGYVVQVYSGVSRQEATRVKESLKTYYPDMESSMEYRQPTYRVQVGRFFDKLEAAKIHNQMKSIYPRAILLPKRMTLNPSDD